MVSETEPQNVYNGNTQKCKIIIVMIEKDSGKPIYT